MRSVLILAAAILLGTGCSTARAQEKVAPPANPTAPADTAAIDSGPLSATSSVDQVLDALDRVGTDLKDFTADVKLTETDNATADSATRTGRVWYQKVGEGDARMRVVFDQPAGAKVEYMLDKGWLVDRDYRRRIEVNRQVLKPGEKMNLLKLGEGPFPLPIGQSKEDVHKLFGVTKVQPKPDDPADTVHVQLTPNPGTQFERKFSAIDVWVDQKTHFPRRIQTLDKNQTTTRTTDLGNIKKNGVVKDGDFVLPAIDENQWQVHREAYQD